MTTTSLEQFIAGLPKAELHVHHVGSASPRIVAELAARHAGSSPVPADPEALAEYFVFRDFAHFIEVYLSVVDLIRDAEDVWTLTYEVARELAGQRVRYAELTLTPYSSVVRGIPAEAYCEAVTRALVRHFGNRMPEVIIEPGRSMVGDAGVIQSEVVLVSRKAANDRKRWVYLDIGKFSGLAETMDESIKYRLRTARDGTRVGPVVLAGPTCDSADVLYEKTEYKLPLSLKPGDKVEILSTGAYTTTYSSVAFNGFAPLKAICI